MECWSRAQIPGNKHHFVPGNNANLRIPDKTHKRTPFTVWHEMEKTEKVTKICTSVRGQDLGSFQQRTQGRYSINIYLTLYLPFLKRKRANLVASGHMDCACYWLCNLYAEEMAEGRRGLSAEN